MDGQMRLVSVLLERFLSIPVTLPNYSGLSLCRVTLLLLRFFSQSQDPVPICWELAEHAITGTVAVTQ